MRTLAALTFIAAVAATGIYVGTRQTFISGEVMAGNMLAQVKAKGIAKITCDDRIPVTPSGAVFTCQLFGDDGSTARFEYKMDREGGLDASLLDSTGATRPPVAPAPGTDIWAD